MQEAQTTKVKNAFSERGRKIAAWFKGLPARTKEKFAFAREILNQGNGKVRASMLLMGMGQLLYRQWAKGILYLLVEIAFLAYFILRGADDLLGFFTLGTVESNAWYGIEGDNSVIMMLMGILAWIALLFYAVLYIANIKDCYAIQCAADTLKAPKSFKKELSV